LGNAFLNLNVPAVFEFRPKVWIHAKAEQDQPENATASKELEHAFWLEEATDVANEFQVQDFAAQYLCSQIKINDGSKIWDCCAGSGGKTLNLSARFNARWFLSDVRSSIIENAQRRLSDLSAHYAVINLENELKTLRFGAKNLSLEYFDAIIADIPCSGSGTWFRTPEHFSLFDYDKLLDYQKRQLNIVQNVIPYLKSGGILYYLTCSVFGAENEEVLSRLDTADLQVESTINFNGLDSGSDSMFMAILRKS
jgi:16S rRNA (cytosine967-C5)-methyltransferase